MKYNELIQKIKEDKAGSKWGQAVRDYAIDMLDCLEDEKEDFANITKEELLNGADDWKAYSYGGSALIYDTDIAETVCTPSELKKTKEGERNPNREETWLDVQARALYQAGRLIERKARV